MKKARHFNALNYFERSVHKLIRQHKTQMFPLPTSPNQFIDDKRLIDKYVYEHQYNIWVLLYFLSLLNENYEILISWSHVAIPPRRHYQIGYNLVSKQKKSCRFIRYTQFATWQSCGQWKISLLQFRVPTRKRTAKRPLTRAQSAQNEVVWWLGVRCLLTLWQ